MAPREAFAQAYSIIGRPLDQLPYTLDFDRLIVIAAQPIQPVDDSLRHEIWQLLLDQRKRAGLPCVGRRRSSR